MRTLLTCDHCEQILVYAKESLPDIDVGRRVPPEEDVASEEFESMFRGQRHREEGRGEEV